jgi:hypothetical protein
MLVSLNIPETGHPSAQPGQIGHSELFALSDLRAASFQGVTGSFLRHCRRRQNDEAAHDHHDGLGSVLAGLDAGGGMAEGPDYNPAPEGPNHQPDHPPQGPKSAPKGEAYGYYCRGQSKKHVKGEKGTAFSRCVKAMAQADKNDALTARKACKTLSKKHVKGVKGTPFSTCVKGVNQMRREEAATVASSSAV